MKQGEQGVSLQEQKAAIQSYAERNGIQIARWFEERETAAKRGRPVFDRMMNMLKSAKADGVVIHKIDRSARNLRDWSDLGEMMDGGIEVHFANEALDMASRGGRLSADIQAVVAADYIRNLREETKKGMRGRYKQGLFPLPAPIGYLDQGGGLPKRIDPVQGPLVKRMFELYASAQYGHNQLTYVMYDLGLRTKRGQRVKTSTISWMLANPFYYGLIRLKSTGQLFEGRHQPLISQTLFRAVREVVDQRLNKRAVKHEFSFRRSVRCATCGYNLSGERVKGYVYYRCHTQSCPTNTIREDRLATSLLAALTPLEISTGERRFIHMVIADLAAETFEQRANTIQSLKASIGGIQDRLSRVTDAYLDGVLDREALQGKQKTLMEERAQLAEQLNEVEMRSDLVTTRLREFVDFAANVGSVFRAAGPTTRQNLLRRVALRVSVNEKMATVLLNKPYRLFASRPQFRSATPNGVDAPEPDSSNSPAERNDAENIGEKKILGHSLAENDRNGCPPQSALRRGVKDVLLEIGNELLTGDPLERIEYSRASSLAEDNQDTGG